MVTLVRTGHVGKVGGTGRVTSDTYFPNVSFLSHFDGADEATAAVDESNTGHTINFNNNAQLDTAQKVFGSSSLLLDGTDDYLDIDDHADFEFGSGDFTVETRFRAAAEPVNSVLLAKYTTTGNQRSWGLFAEDATTIRFIYSTDGAGATTVVDSDAITIATDTWYAAAVSRVGNNGYIFFDGTLVKTFDLTGVTVFGGTSPLFVGTHTAGASSDFNGHIDEARITKGVGRYSESYGLAGAPFKP